MLSTPHIKELNRDNNDNRENSNGNNIYEIKKSGSKINFGNKIYKLTEVDEDIPSFHRNCIFIFFLLSNLFLNYDTGVIPASLIEITKEINLDYSEQALLGSLVYLGLSCSSLFVSVIFSNYSPSKVCSSVLLLNCLSCFTFSLTSNKIILFVTRFLMGATEAFIVIYGPVWVNNYSPLEYSTTWMGILHSCTVLGVVTGYISASIIINFFSPSLTWRFSIQIQGFAEILFALFFWFENDEYINVDVRKTISINDIELDNRNFTYFNNSNVNNNIYSITVPHASNASFPANSRVRNRKFNPRIDSIETSNLGRYLLQAKIVLTTPLYISITLGLCSIYFIVTGIQFWMTKYLIEILGGEPILVNTLFSIISVTAPLSGVILGGTFSDKYGGYKGENAIRAIKICIAFGLISFVFAFPMGFLFQIIYLCILLWTFLFFGAAIIPIGTGIMISSVQKDCQATSSSISQLIFNLLGYFFSPMLTGYIMDRFVDKRQGFIWGMRVVFWWVIFSLIFFILSYIIAIHKYESQKNNPEDSEESSMVDESMKENMSNFMKLEINRRLAQGNKFL
jgi:MFS family permease